jgi:hypothetical protein
VRRSRSKFLTAPWVSDFEKEAAQLVAVGPESEALGDLAQSLGTGIASSVEALTDFQIASVTQAIDYVR